MSPARAKAQIQDFLDSQVNWNDLSEDFAFNIILVSYEFKFKIEYILDMEIWKFNEIIYGLQKIYKMKQGESGKNNIPSVLG